MKTALGDFTYDKEYRCYNAFLSWNGQNTDVAILDAAGEEDARKAVDVLAEYAQDMAGFDLSARKFAAGTLSEKANAAEDAFISALTMIGLTVYPSGTVEVYYDDGDLFSGSTIVVTRNADGFCNAEISI